MPSTERMLLVIIDFLVAICPDCKGAGIRKDSHGKFNCVKCSVLSQILEEAGLKDKV